MPNYAMDVILSMIKDGLYLLQLCVPALNLEKENNKGFCVIDSLNEQHIVIGEESHDWPNIL